MRFNYNNDPFAKGEREYQQELINKVTASLKEISDPNYGAGPLIYGQFDNKDFF